MSDEWNDDRADALSHYVLATIKLKEDKWKKMIAVEELRQLIIDFFEKKDLMQIVFVIDSKGGLEPQYDFPRSSRSKAVYFRKKEPLAVNKDNVKDLVKGDLSYSPVDQLSALLEGVFLPMLSNEKNSSRWPGVVSRDVVAHAQALRTSASVVCGKMRGETPLPLPPGMEDLVEDGHGTSSDSSSSDHSGDEQAAEGEGSQPSSAASSRKKPKSSAPPRAVGKAAVHAIESAVIEWSKQVREVLKRDSAQPLMNNEHPGPLVELDFWQAQKKSLESIDQQLNSSKMVRMRDILQEQNSSYSPALEQMVGDVHHAVDQASDIVLHLEPLRSFLEELEEGNMEEIVRVFKQIMHVLRLIWGHSKHYATPRHFVVLLREIMNQVIVAVVSHVEPRSIFAQEPDEALEKIDIALKVVDDIDQIFSHTRIAVNAAHKQDVSKKPWDFESALILKRLQEYRERVQLVRNIFADAQDWTKLEKVELSGDKLNNQVKWIFERSKEALEHLQKATSDEGYDCLNPGVPDFIADYETYMAECTDYDMRLAAIAKQTVGHAPSLEQAFKTIVGFQGLLQRPRIANELEDEYPRLVRMFDEELNIIKALFDKCKLSTDVDVNMPRTSGLLKAVLELRRRAKAAKSGFDSNHHHVFDQPEAQRIFAKYEELLTLMSQYEEQVFRQWSSGVDERSADKLAQPLIVRNSQTELIAVNFDPQLVAVLREVKYLQQLKEDGGELPSGASELFARNEALWQQRANLDIAVTEYNRIQDTLLDVEEPLVQKELNDIDAKLERGISQLNWNSDGISEYCESVKDQIESLSTRIQRAKANVHDMIDTMKRWYEQPLLERDAKTGLLSFADRKKLMNPTMTTIAEDGKRFHFLLQENKELFKSGSGSDWDAYVAYVDQVIVGGLFNTIHRSITYIIDSMDQGEDAESAATKPLQEAKMLLVSQDIGFEPGIADNDGSPTLLEQNETIVSDIFSVGDLFPRMTDPSSNAIATAFRTKRDSKAEIVAAAAAAQADEEAGQQKDTQPKSELQADEDKSEGGDGAEKKDDKDEKAAVEETAEASKEEPETEQGQTESSADTKEAEGSAAASEVQESSAKSDTAEDSKAAAQAEAEKDPQEEETESTPPPRDTYRALLEGMEELTELRDELLIKVKNAIVLVMDQRQMLLSEYSPLWTDSRDDYLREFLEYGRVLTSAERELVEEESEEAPEKSPPELSHFKAEIDRFNNIATKVDGISDVSVFDGWLRIKFSAFRYELYNIVKRWSYVLLEHLQKHVTTSLDDLEAFIKDAHAGLQKEVPEGDYDALVAVMKLLNALEARTQATDALFEPLTETVTLLASYDVEVAPGVHQQLTSLPEKWQGTKKLASKVANEVSPLQTEEVAKLKRRANQFDVRNFEFREDFLKRAPLRYDSRDVYRRIDAHYQEYLEMESEMNELADSASLFSVTLPEYKQLRTCRRELRMLKHLWDTIYSVRSQFASWKTTLWQQVNVENMEIDCKRMVKEIRQLDKETRAWEAFNGVDGEVKNMITSLGSVGLLQSPAIRDRHWEQLMNATGVSIVMSDNTSLADLLALNLHEYEDEVASIVDRANKEQGMEKTLKELDTTWSQMNFEYDEHPRTKIKLLKASEELIETLEDNQVQVQALMMSKYIAFFEEQVSSWQTKLSTADSVIEIWFEVQRTWSHLEAIFIGSEDIRMQLPEDSKRFDSIDVDFKEIAGEAASTPNVIEATNKKGLYERLEDLQERLGVCEKALQEYLETKRLAFPRFYFVSGTDLLDILSNGNDPAAVSRQLSKLFQAICNIKLDQDDPKLALGMYALDGEYVDFPEPVKLVGRVEDWLNKLLDTMRSTIRTIMTEAIVAYEEKPRSEWVFDYPAQISLVGTQVWWATEVTMAFSRLEEGFETAMKDYNKKQVSHLNDLIVLLQGKLTKPQRVMLQTICTVDVHSRDIVQALIASKEDNVDCFQWQCQLRHIWDEQNKHCRINICDARFTYSYEYLGNVPRLVITPLTDRCYITLTQSLHLIMSGAPAGPAGTGKTETTKDLGRNIGIMVYVFNCSEQMDYKSVGNIYKGLAQTGAWGCFDEFNRISVEVLSVVAVQVKTIQDAIRAKKKRFDFLGEEISLNPTVGIYITMNPGYAGRTELPENIKALFRPCAMVVPDYGMICEIMLVSEGFLNAKLLARKFITLYMLNRDLLSKQDHYDWGLRAIKSVLVVAGSLKRADPDRSEDEVLMRALRDFNIPKIVNEDLPVFMGLISDLFPGLDVPRKRDLEFEKDVREAVLSLGLQAEDSFLLKIVQLQELLDVRHSVFVLGGAATGKSCVLKSLYKTYQLQKKKPVWADINPKAVTNHELYGYINLATREWVDGLFSSIMRDISNINNDAPKWIVLDGDIDTMWIESLNTVMDDNKVLTLASNERIALKPSMRLLFEIANLTYASPATVSRAGILYVNPTDLGWAPFVSSWIQSLQSAGQRTNLMMLFEKYVPPCLEVLKTRFKTVTPMTEWSMVNTLCHLLELLLTEENTPEGCSKEDYELYFAWAAVWAFGGQLFKDQLVDWREEFSKWWSTEFKTIKFPTSGTVFDYYIEDKKFVGWSQRVPEFVYDPEVPLSAALVPTSETVRIRFWMDLLVQAGHPVLLVGAPGTGKTAMILDKLKSLDDDWVVAKTAFNHYTTHHMIQAVLEAPLEKKAGKNFGPPGNKRLIYFVDDLNMPEVDLYGTASPHTVMRQHLDYDHWYDRQKHSLKCVTKTQYIASMNPKAGSFTINPRLQRHFSVFAISAPGTEAATSIYNALLDGHLKASKFPNAILKVSEKLVEAAIKLHNKVVTTFLPTAIKFHYVFNLRDLSNLFQGMAFSTPEMFKTPLQFARLLMHEAERVYGDKLVDKEDLETFDKLESSILTEAFPDVEQEQLLAQPRIHCHFASGIGDPKYKQIKDMPSLKGILDEALSNYNEVNAAMNLVLFKDAMQHVCRINRILELPRGNALLVGVGGSGKQSLSRLAASISGLDSFQITLTKGYGMNELKADLAQCFIKSGQKGQGVMFLMTDAQVADEKFLVLINDLLTSGTINGLFADDERNDIIDGVRGEVKGAGLDDSNDGCWQFFIDRVRRLLKVVLCFSPVGDTLRKRARKFPGLVNCTSIDWFHEWPHDALVSVAQNFLEEVETVPTELKEPISVFMAHVHGTVNDVSERFLLQERRHNYTTPKSYLEQISLFLSLMDKKHTQLQNAMERMENGLSKLKSTAAQVDDLKEKLKAQEIELAQKNAEADALIEKVGVETEKVNKEKEIAAEEEEKVRVINEDVSAKQKSCEEDLAKAEPALLAAQEALNTLNKNNLTELKSFGSPPTIVVRVSAAVMVLLAKGKIPKDRSWKACKGIMGNVGEFLDNLLNYDKENIPDANLKAVQEYLDDPEFEPDFVRGKSLAAAGLCAWVRNIVTFYRIFCDVEPKRQALAAANAQLEAAQSKLSKIMAKIRKLDEALAKLTAEFEEATNAKLKCQAEADATNKTISLANRLVGGLASEKERWGEAVAKFKEQGKTLPGDVLMTTAFISYAGCFTKVYRNMLYDEKWLPYIKDKSKIPISEGLDPLDVLTDAASIAEWQNQNLPADRVSTENATILTNAMRWPLIIDPQEQGIKWIKKREGEALRVVRLGQRSYLDTIERAVSNGECVLIENLGEEVDAVLDNLLGRQTIKKGRAVMIGDKEVEYSPDFRLILHTKMANPHYKPEMQAQCTLINFTVTQSGLEDQLLADVVTAERPDLQELKAKLTSEQNEYMITLKRLEDDLLARLSSAEGDFLRDEALVLGLENTKKTAAEIEEKVALAKTTEVEINTARENYRPAAARAALLYFIINELDKIHPMYQVSLKAFSVVFAHAISIAEKAEDVKERVTNITDTITFSVFNYVSRGLFERDKLIFAAQMVFQILKMRGEVVDTELDFLLKAPAVPNSVSPVDFLSHQSWGCVKTLSQFEAFSGFDRDIEGSAKRWKKFVESEVPEREKFPGEWKNKTLMQQLCMMRCLRPDRMLYAIRYFVSQVLGEKYTAGRSIEFAKSFEETSKSTGVFFILSPGVNPIYQVEQLGKKLGFTFDNGNYHQVSLGQGQEVVAEAKLDLAAKEGHWVVLENIHLVKKWLPSLEKKLEHCSEIGHENFRYFLTAEPAGTPQAHIIPQGILQACIKITNEPPTGIQANLHAALDNFDQDTLEMCAKENEFRKLLFSLVYFHAVILERRKFGPMGWNRNYPFNTGDLTISVNVLFNYLENNSVVPWTDLRYLFGEIMYGGHITDNLDRRLCNTYLLEYMKPEMLDSDLELAPGFLSPNSMDYMEYHNYIDEQLPEESPYLYGMHPNAEIEFLTSTSQRLFDTVLDLQPRTGGGGGGAGGGQTRDEQLKAILDDILEKLPEEFNMLELNGRCPPEERTPYTVVAFQETARMNRLTSEIRRSLKELNLGLKGELTITEAMEELSTALLSNKVPSSWEARAYPSTKALGMWYADLLERIKFLDAWSTDFALPSCVWLGGLFNPQSFLTAIMQQTARKNEWPLDKMCIQCDVTKKFNKEDFSSPPREGCYIYGLYMEGARWDTGSGMIQDAKMKELTPPMPVIFLKAIPVDKQDARGTYECPVFKTKERGRANEQVAVGLCPGFVWYFNLKTKANPNKWILAGVALLLSE